MAKKKLSVSSSDAVERHDQMLNQFIDKHFDSESDRGIILVFGAILDEVVGDMIRCRCVNAEVASTFLAHGGTAGTFEDRIAICEAFGTLHPDDVATLRAIQKIRNRGAHFDSKSGDGLDVLFDSQVTVDRVRTITSLMGEPLTNRKSFAVRAAFVYSAMTFCSHLTSYFYEDIEVNSFAGSAATARQMLVDGGHQSLIEDIAHDNQNASPIEVCTLDVFPKQFPEDPKSRVAATRVLLFERFRRLLTIVNSAEDEHALGGL